MADTAIYSFGRNHLFRFSPFTYSQLVPPCPPTHGQHLFRIRQTAHVRGIVKSIDEADIQSHRVQRALLRAREFESRLAPRFAQLAFLSATPQSSINPRRDNGNFIYICGRIRDGSNGSNVTRRSTRRPQPRCMHARARDVTR